MIFSIQHQYWSLHHTKHLKVVEKDGNLIVQCFAYTEDESTLPNQILEEGLWSYWQYKDGSCRVEEILIFADSAFFAEANHKDGEVVELIVRRPLIFVSGKESREATIFSAPCQTTRSSRSKCFYLKRKNQFRKSSWDIAPSSYMP